MELAFHAKSNYEIIVVWEDSDLDETRMIDLGFQNVPGLSLKSFQKL